LADNNEVIQGRRIGYDDHVSRRSSSSSRCKVRRSCSKSSRLSMCWWSACLWEHGLVLPGYTTEKRW
jgi:hypothetical protein